MSVRRKHKLLITSVTIVILALALTITLLTRPAKAPAPSVSLKGHTFSVTVADTPASRAQGLSGTTSLAQNHGMLFTFEPAEIACFWMKDMEYNLDILWFDTSNKLVKVEKNL